MAAVLGTLRRLHLDRLIDSHAGRELDLVVSMIVARVLQPASKLATSRAYQRRISRRAPLTGI